MTTAGLFNARNGPSGTSRASAGGPGILTRMLLDVASVVHVSGIEGPSLTFLNVIGQFGWLEGATPVLPPAPNDVSHAAAGS